MPQLAVPTFADLPIPLVIPGRTIKAVVLDKDNCFAKPYDDNVWPAYDSKWKQLKEHYKPDQLLIVSNTAGTGDDKDYEEARRIEQNTGVPVLRHETKKPGCHREILDYFKSKNVCDSAADVAVVGDRLFTDILMANMMGAAGVWISKGVVVPDPKYWIIGFEHRFYQRLLDRGYQAPK